MIFVMVAQIFKNSINLQKKFKQEIRRTPRVVRGKAIKTKANPEELALKSGGEEEDRTPDLRIANATLSQLSYPPTTALF